MMMMVMLLLVLAVMQQFADSWGNIVQNGNKKVNEIFFNKPHKHEN